MRLRTMSVAVAVLAVAVAISGCSSGGAPAPKSTHAGSDKKPLSLSKLIVAAKKEGTLTWYSADGEDVNTVVVNAFEKQYGIKVQVLRAAVDDVNQRVTSEAQTGVNNADVLTVSDPTVFNASPQIFMPTNAHTVLNWNKYPKLARYKDQVLLRDTPPVIQYNTKLVPGADIPKTWKDMLKPFWKGHILLTDPSSSPTYMGWAKVMIQEYGVSYLKKLAKQKFTLVESGGPGAQQVAAGSAYANFPARTVHSTALRASGAPIAYVIQGGPLGAPIDSGVLAAAPHPNAARLFLYYQMSIKGQQDICDAGFEVSSFYPTNKVTGCLPLTPHWKMPNYTVTDAQKAQILGALGLN